MAVYTIKNTRKRCFLSIDRSKVNAAAIAGILDGLRAEELVRKADFPDDAAKIGGEIKKEWWKRNKERYLKGIPL
jgi:hypothetical protein